MKERDQLANHLLKQLNALNPKEQEFEKSNLSGMLSQAGALTFNPPLNPNEEFLNQAIRDNVELNYLLNPQSMKNAMSGDSPSDSISRLLPSDAE